MDTEVKQTAQVDEMQEDRSRLRILKANHGDAFILEVKRGHDRFTMVIDGGPRLANRIVIPELVKLSDKGIIDIMALTHFDNDHIHGLLEFIRKHRDRVGKIKKFWFTLPERVIVADDSPQLTYEEARDLRDGMERLEKETGKKIDWRERVIADEKSDQPLFQNDLVTIWVLAPSEEDIVRNERCFRKKIGEEQVNVNLSGSNEKQPLRPLEEIWEEEWKDPQSGERCLCSVPHRVLRWQKVPDVRRRKSRYHRKIITKDEIFRGESIESRCIQAFPSWKPEEYKEFIAGYRCS